MKTKSAILASQLKTELKTSFPGMKFSVKSDNFSMGSSIDIKWIDGPTVKDVEKITNKFEDISRDSYTGEILSGGNRYVSCVRNFSEETKRRIFDELKSEYAILDDLELNDFDRGMMTHDQQSLIWKTLCQLNLYNQTEKTSKQSTNLQSAFLSITVTHDRDWTWLKFADKPDETTREILKSHGGRFSGKRVAWYFTEHIEEDQIKSWLNVVLCESTNLEQKPILNNSSEAIANKLEKIADNMQKTIDNKLNPACGRQNYTARRARMASSVMEEGYKLKDIQTIIYQLADHHKHNTINPLLINISSKTLIELLYTYKNNMDCKPDSWWYENRLKLEKAGVTYKNYDEIKSLLLTMAKDDNREQQQKQREMENKVKSLIGAIPGFFPTPKNVTEILLSESDIEEGQTILEPSAGSGSIADQIKSNYNNVELFVIEYNNTLCEMLEMKGHNLIGRDFLEYNNGRRFDRIVMNPPFENGQDIDHVQHAFNLLSDDGRLVSVMSAGPFFRSDKKSKAFQEWFELNNGYKVDLPENSFKESLTGVNACYVVIDK
jgi:16S rRNA G1207 methylase RsmC